MFKELQNLIRFFWHTKEEEKALVFYAEHEGYYVNFEGIINILLKKLDKPFCYVTSDADDPILQRTEPMIHTFYINKLLSTFMTMVKCKVFVMTLTDLNQFHLKRSKHPVHYNYVFHSLISTHMSYRLGAFDHYDSVLCTGPYHIKEIRKHEANYGLKQKELISAGYYRLERIYQAYQEYLVNNPISRIQKTILIAPSWGKENLLETCGEELVRILLRKGYEVIVRPHPETARRNPKLISSLLSDFGEDSDFTLEMSVSTDDSILRADVLICDLSGIALEYALGTERPVLFVDAPLKVNNEKYNDIGIEPIELKIRSRMGVVISMEDIDQVPQKLSELLSENDNYKQVLEDLRKELVFSFLNSSEIGADYLISLL